MIRFTVILAALAGCYKPSVGDCAYNCSSANTCPNDLTCDTSTGICRDPAMMGTSCSEGPADTADPLCGWAYSPQNFNPCDLVAITPAALTVSSSNGGPQQVLDGDTGVHNGSVIPHVTSADGKTTIFHVSTLTVANDGVSLHITGSHAIIFAVEGAVHLDGDLNVNATNTNGANPSPGPGGGSCVAGDGVGANDGGGGGGFGQDGAMGGGGSGSNGGVHFTGLLVPLIGGCNGGKSGLTSASDGNGGGGGGALQISANAAMTVTGSVEAGGAGGGGGAQGGSGGGGGGGSGGAIVLEAPSVTVNNASICANGGGGGSGAGNGAQDGADGACSTSPAMGGTGAGGKGGDGGTGMFNPMAGVTQAGTSGGGGGGTGRIVLIGHPMKDLGTSTISPSPE